MKSLSRDVVLTLIVKLSLLFLLWYVCINGVEKPSLTAKQWIMGHQLTTTGNPLTPEPLTSAT